MEGRSCRGSLTPLFDRRTFLRQAGVGAAALRTARASAWEAGSVAHLLPTASHERILLKASFKTALARAPELRVGGRRVAGLASDTRGRFWAFDVPGLAPDTEYELELAAAGRQLASPWRLRTLPASSARPERLRLLVYTCAGGHDLSHDVEGRAVWLPVDRRRRLLRRGLSFRPDAVIAIGDHVYWDQRAGRPARWMGASEAGIRSVGRFDRSLPVLGSANEAVLDRAVSPQIVDLYGTDFRSVPVFFLQDDHDYFENDHADDTIITFPPDPFMLALARATQRLYYPEFLPDAARPTGLGGASAADRPPGIAESFGTLRYGQLAELLLYDCRRFLTLNGPTATFVPAETEQWLLARMRASECAHVVQVPSTPSGWSAGKWAEWYPDLLEPSGRLGTTKPKPYWQQGWRAQHDRLLAAASAMKGRIPMLVSGDLHCLAEGRIHRSGAIDLRANPVVSILSGPISTGTPGWPSAFRGTGALPPTGLETEERLKPLEENGFTILELTPGEVTARFFRYSAAQPPEVIDTLEPFRTIRYSRP
jgi:phosphodiesterase/alkaline phosphatase D-like protein